MLLNSLKVSVLLYFWSVREIKLLISSPLKLYAWTLHHKYLIGSKSSYKSIVFSSEKVKKWKIFTFSFCPKKTQCTFTVHLPCPFSPYPDALFSIRFERLSVADRGFVSLLLAGVIFLKIALI